MLVALLLLAPAAPACRIEVTSGAPAASPAPAAPAVPAAAAGRAAAAPRPASPAAAPASRGQPPPWEADGPAPDPEARRQFLARAAEPSAKLEPAAKPPRVTALALDNTARGEAPGMRPEGGAHSATLAEGEVAVVPVTLAAGECATFIAQGGIGLVEVDLFLTTRGSSQQVLAEDPRTGPIAVIGGGGACFTPPGRAPLAGELHVQARRGAGVVLVQGYRRAAGR